MPKNEWIASRNTPDEAKTEKHWKTRDASFDLLQARRWPQSVKVNDENHFLYLLI